MISENCLLILDISVTLFWTWSFELGPKLKLNVVCHWILVQGSKNPNFVHKYKPLFWKSKTNFETFWKIHPHNEFICKLLLKSAKRLEQIFWLIEYCCQAQESKKWQICSMNSKLFFGKTKQTYKLSNVLVFILELPKFKAKYKFLSDIILQT